MSFDEFLTARLSALLRYATVLACDPHLAEDVVQEVMARAHPRWSRIAAADAPEAYVKRMIINELISWRRRRASRVIPLSHEALAVIGGLVGDAADRIVERDALIQQIAGLPVQQRIVIGLRYYEGLPDDQIANVLGCAVATVRSHAARGLATLRKRITVPIDESGRNR